MSENKNRGAVLITGASSGIGSAIARELLKEGYPLALHAFRNGAALSGEFGGAKNVKIYSADLTDINQINEMAQSVARDFGSLYGLVNNAGEVFGASTAESISEEAWDATFALNAKAPYFLFQALLPHFSPEGARVVNISSISPKYGGSPKTLHYGASKGALEVITRGLAKWGAPKNILVNAIQPGLIETGIHERIGRSREELEERIKKIPLGRIGKPEEIAYMAEFLLSSRASFITGQIFGVTGGD